MLLFFDCFSVDILKCWAKIKKQILTTSETPAPNNNRSFCIAHCTSDRKAFKVKTAHPLLTSHHASVDVWDNGCRWIARNLTDLKSCFPNQLHPVTVLILSLSTREGLRLKCFSGSHPVHPFSVLGQIQNYMRDSKPALPFLAIDRQRAYTLMLLNQLFVYHYMEGDHFPHQRFHPTGWLGYSFLIMESE